MKKCEELLLFDAADYKKWDRLKFLIGLDANINLNSTDGKNIFQVLCEKEKWDLIEYILEQSNFELPTLLQKNNFDQTPFDLASLHGQDTFAKKILNKIAELDINCRIDNQSLLTFAYQHGFKECVEFIIDQTDSFDSDFWITEGNAFLSWAQANHREDLIEIVNKKMNNWNVSTNQQGFFSQHNHSEPVNDDMIEDFSEDPSFDQASW